MDHMHRTRADEVSLITSASASYDDEYAKRRKKYAIMMGTRALCVLLAATTYRVSFVLAMAFVIAGVVLPWCAVLIANDRPPKRRAVDLGYVQVPAERALPPGAEDDRVVDG